jgi:hypothetical protein
MTADWIADYRASVSWGDQIHADRVPSTGEQCCWFPYNGGRHYTTPGWLGAGLAESLARAIRCRAATGTKTTLLFLDQHATDYQVEEALWVSSRAGVGCGFLEAQPMVLYSGLLLRLSEGCLLEEALHRLKSA